jgi:RNA polymerase sigma factor (sigma-70 family)
MARKNPKSQHLPLDSDVAALAKMLEEHKPRLLGMLRNRLDGSLGVRIEPEDIVNQVFILARRKWARFQEKKWKPYNWLYRLARDCISKAWEHETRDRRDLSRHVPYPEASSVQLGLGLISPYTTPTGAAARAEVRAQVQHTLALLDTDEREIIWMRYFEGLSGVDIAEILGITSQLANLRCFRAVKRFGKLWVALHGNEKKS